MHVEKVPSGSEFRMNNRILYSQAAMNEKGFFKSMEIHLLEQSGSSMIKYFGHDYRKISYMSESGTLSISYSLYGTAVDEKKLKVNHDFILFDTAFYALQKRLQNGVESFQTHLVFSESGEKQDAEYRLLKTKSLLNVSPQYQAVPSFFKNASKFDYEVNVYEIGFSGIAGFFFPHKFYFAFDPKADNSFLAYWGGDTAYPNYWIATQEAF